MPLLEGLLWLTLNVYHEARSEPPIAQSAVALVTLNRAHEKKMPIKAVVQEPHQFSWTLRQPILICRMTLKPFFSVCSLSILPYKTRISPKVQRTSTWTRWSPTG